MTPADLLTATQAAGLSLTLDATGALRVRGPSEGLAIWTPAIREAKAALVELLTPRRLWLIRHAGGEVVSASFTPPATLPEVRAWHPGALSIEPEEDDTEGAEVSAKFADTPEGEPAPPAEFEPPPDDRITCRQCCHLTGARCQAAHRGAFSHRARWYEPDPEARHACYLFAPLPHDPDQRAGADRWPSLGWMMRTPT